jgi:hypothetical protein
VDREYPPPEFDTDSYCRRVDRNFILQSEFCHDRLLASLALPFSAREASPTSGSDPLALSARQREAPPESGLPRLALACDVTLIDQLFSRSSVRIGHYLRGRWHRKAIKCARRRIGSELPEVTKEVIAAHVLLARSLFGGGNPRRLLLRFSPVKSSSAPARF